MQLELWIFVLFIYLFLGVNVVNAFAGWCVDMGDPTATVQKSTNYCE